MEVITKKNKHPLYETWRTMKLRCLNKNCKPYKNYGGRGIKICDRWINSFDNFLEDMGEKPSHEHTLDRVNNDGDYTRENCKWSTPEEQANNRRTNVLITFKGKTQTRADWAKEMGISLSLIQSRQNRKNPIEQVLSQVKLNLNKKPKPSIKSNPKKGLNRKLITEMDTMFGSLSEESFFY